MLGSFGTSLISRSHEDTKDLAGQSGCAHSPDFLFIYGSSGFSVGSESRFISRGAAEIAEGLDSYEREDRGSLRAVRLPLTTA